MFQPNSVRGLLSRKNKSRLESQDKIEGVPAGGDADFEDIVSGKLLLKDVEGTIKDIREWRNYQNSLLKEKLASNEAIAKVSVQEYLSHLEREDEREQEEREKLMKKLVHLGEEVVEGEGWSSSDTNLFQCLAASNRTVDQRKYDQDTQQDEVTSGQLLMGELQSIGEAILRREEKKPQGETKTVDRSLIKKELQEIDDELKEIQELLKD